MTADIEPTDLEDLGVGLAQAQRGRARDVLYFLVDVSCFPSDAGVLEDVEVGIIDFTYDEEMGIIRGLSEGESPIGALAKASMRFWQGRPIKMAEGEGEEIWLKLGSRGRAVVLAAFQRHYSASKEAAKKMADSFRVKRTVIA
jgi:hypothetical protein